MSTQSRAVEFYELECRLAVLGEILEDTFFSKACERALLLGNSTIGMASVPSQLS